MINSGFLFEKRLISFSYEWRKVHLFYATNGQIQVGGRHSCQLMMKSMVEYLKKEPNFTFGTYDIETATSVDYSEALKTHVGTSYGGKRLKFSSLYFLFDIFYIVN